MATVEVHPEEELRSPREHRRRRRLWVIGVLGVLAVVVVLLFTVQVDRHVTAKGYVVAATGSQLRPLVTAAVAEVHAADADRVKAGAVVISLAAEQAAVELKLAQARLAAAAPGSREQKLARLETARAEAALETFQVRTPVAGRLHLQPLHPGEVVAAGSLLGEVFGTGRRVTLRVGERDLGRVAAGQPVELRYTSRSLPTGRGEITAIRPVVRADRRAGYREVTCSVTPEDLPVGATCEARIRVGRSSLAAMILNR